MTKLKAKSPELVKTGKAKMVLFGASGVGKTQLALSFPKPYYYDIEGGAKGPQYRELLKQSGGAYMGPEEGTLSGETLIDQVKALATEKHEFKTLICDSLTKLFQTMIAQEAERLGSKDAFGASKKPAVAMMRQLCHWITMLDMNVIFICHESAEWGIVDGQRAEVGKVPDVWDKLIYELDLSIRAVKQGPSRTAIVTKSRLTAFPDGTRFPLEYGEFAARFGKEVVEGESEVGILALPEQLADIKRLLEIVKTDEATIQKDFDKLGVNSFAEMTSTQIQVRIDSLKKKLST